MSKLDFKNLKLKNSFRIFDLIKLKSSMKKLIDFFNESNEDSLGFESTK